MTDKIIKKELDNIILEATVYADELIDMLKSKVRQLFYTEIFSKRYENGQLVGK